MKPYRFTVDNELGYLHTKYYGELQPSDLREAVIEGNASFPGLDSIVDFTDASLRKISRLDMQGLIHIASAHEPTEILAAFVAPNDLEFGLTRMYDLLLEEDLPQNRRVFRTLKEAEDWFRTKRREASQDQDNPNSDLA